MKHTVSTARVGLIALLVCLFFGTVLVRLFHLQVIKADEYREIVEKQTTGKVTLNASRGILYDRNGQVVANNVYLKSLYAFPKNQTEVQNVARYLERSFGLNKGTAVKKYKLEPNRFRWIERRLPDSIANQILREKPSGLHYEEEPARVYPYGLIGKQIIGFTNIDSKGQSGVELMFDTELAGVDGEYGYRRDAHSKTYRIERNPIKKSVSGKSKILTIDWRLQEILEEELRNGVEKYNAKNGMAVFINNNNGEILAAAHFDPDEKNPQMPYKLRPFTDLFEPGSIFKGITAAGFLEEGIVNFNDSVYGEKGKWLLNGRTFHDDKELEWLKFRDIIVLSSNIGMAKYAIEMSGERVVDYLNKYTVGEKAGLGWPGEPSGSIATYKKWSDINLANLVIGHGVATSPLQMAMYFSAIANGGSLYRPRIVLSDVDKSGKPINRTRKELIAEVMSKVTSDSLRSFMLGVVDTGTATPVKSDLVTIAGKTGTAQIFDFERGCYSYRDYMASFAGFFPAEKPLITGIVVYESPQPIHYGGYTAGPTFRRIAERYVMLNPDLFTTPSRLLAEKSNKFENTTVVPEVIGHPVSQARLIAQEKKLTVRTTADSGTVVWQFPPADRIMFENDELLVAVESTEQPVMPDLKGLTIREVSAFLSLAGIKYTVRGNGRVKKQSIQPGKKISDDLVCVVECKPI